MPFRKRYHARKFYFKILISFSLLSILVVLTTSVFISSIYMKNVYTQLENNYSFSVERMNTSLDNIFTSLNELNINLRQYPDVNTFLISKLADTPMIMNITSLLVPITSMNPYLYSTILYNKDYRYPISSGKSGVNLSQFIHERLRHPVIRSNLNLVTTSVTQYQTIGLKPLNAISIVFSDSENANAPIEHGIIMTLDMEELQKNVLSKYDGISLLMDEKRNILLSNYNTQTDSSLTGGAYLNKIMESNSTSGSFRTKIGGETKIVTFTRNPSTSLYLINIRSYQDIQAIIHNKVVHIVMICIGIILLYFILAFFLSRRIYSPIEETAKMFSHYSKTSPDRDFDELSFISTVFAESLEKIRQLELSSSDLDSRRKGELLSSVLKNSDIPEYVKKDIQEMNLTIRFENLVLVLLKTDDRKDINRHERYAYEISLIKAIPELIDSRFDCEVVNLYQGELAIFLNFKEEVLVDMKSLTEMLQQVLDHLHHHMNIHITAGIGGVLNNIDDCSTAYIKAAELVKNRFIIGMNRVISEDSIKQLLTNTPVLTKEQELNLINSIKANKRQSYSDQIEGIIDMLKTCDYSKAVSLLFQVMTLCIKAMDDTIALEGEIYHLNFEEFNQLFSRLKTLDDAKAWLMNLYEEYQKAYGDVVKVKNQKYEGIVDLITKYVKENYRDPDLGLDLIAGITNYAPYYVSKIFKDLTGISVIDYIRETRIKQAKLLLETTSMKASDIGTVTGFSNTSNFYLVFKKDVGLAPVEYRQSIHPKE